MSAVCAAVLRALADGVIGHVPAPTSPTGPGRRADAAAARDRFAVLPPILERVAGAEHPDNLTNRTNLAHWIR